MEGPAERATPLSDQATLIPPPTGWNPATRGPLHPRSRVPLPRWGRRGARCCFSSPSGGGGPPNGGGGASRAGYASVRSGHAYPAAHRM
ncbi:hypothetical protein CA607_03445 [Caulobacter vibrioides]|nr:hypothetical protein CA607_03445 [Caulobacter vibrioides]